jgi:GNAT superfamily N-acetyltransferase
MTIISNCLEHCEYFSSYPQNLDTHNVQDFYTNENIQWEKFSKQIMDIETTNFHKTLSESEESLQFTFNDKKSIFIIMTLNGKFVGYICGGKIENYIEENEQEYNSYLNEHSCYVESINIHKDFQGKGYGKVLFRQFYNTCKQRGFKYITGHFSNGASTNVALKFNGKTLLKIDDYCNTGLLYNYILIEVI